MVEWLQRNAKINEIWYKIKLMKNLELTWKVYDFDIHLKEGINNKKKLYTVLKIFFCNPLNIELVKYFVFKKPYYDNCLRKCFQ